MRNRILKIYFFAFIIFLYLPILILILFSFNENKGRTFTGFSLKWYMNLFGKSDYFRRNHNFHGGCLYICYNSNSSRNSFRPGNIPYEGKKKKYLSKLYLSANIKSRNHYGSIFYVAVRNFKKTSQSFTYKL